MLQHYSLCLITLDDVLTFLDRLVEEIGEQNLRKLLAGKYSREFISEIATTAKLLNGISQIQEGREEKEEPLHPNLDTDRLLEIIRELPEGLDLELLQKLLKHASREKYEMEHLLGWIDALPNDDPCEVTAMDKINESDFTLLELAQAIKRNPERLRDLVNGDVERINGHSTIAELVELLL